MMNRRCVNLVGIVKYFNSMSANVFFYLGIDVALTSEVISTQCLLVAVVLEPLCCQTGCPPLMRYVAGSFPGRVIPKTIINMVQTDFLLEMHVLR